nr:hypothetical protein CFP56_77976 [Quercus suber]
MLQNPKEGERYMREDVSDAMIETLYRQVARIVLQLSRLDFSQIGSLSMNPQEDSGGYAATVNSRPVTLKAHDILTVGGEGVFCMFFPLDQHCREAATDR